MYVHACKGVLVSVYCLWEGGLCLVICMKDYIIMHYHFSSCNHLVSSCEPGQWKSSLSTKTNTLNSNRTFITFDCNIYNINARIVNTGI